jgi:hypothetical protein
METPKPFGRNGRGIQMAMLCGSVPRGRLLLWTGQAALRHWGGTQRRVRRGRHRALWVGPAGHMAPRIHLIG